MDNSLETDKTLTYQRKIEALYANEAAANFKREHFPADPFDDGVLVDAAYLNIPDLVAIYKAAKTLERQGNAAFVNTLILSRGEGKTEMVRVNPLWVDASRQRKLEICKLLDTFYWGTSSTFAEKGQEIIEMGDAQLLEYLQQVGESLDLTARELEVIIDAEV